MTASERSLGNRWFEEVWNEGRREAIAEFLAPDALLHDGGNDAVGPDGFYPLFDRLNTAFSGIRLTVDDIFTAGDKICIRWTFRAIHTGPGLGATGTGAKVGVTGMCIFRIANNQIVEAWQNWDMLGMMTQIQGSPKAPTYVN